MNYIIWGLAIVGALSLAFIAWATWIIRTSDKQNQQPEYTEEEKLYAELLLMKHDLDADAYATRKKMMEEVNAQEQGGTFYKKMRDAFNPKD